MPDPVISIPSAASKLRPWLTLVGGAIAAFLASYQLTSGDLGASITAAVGFIVGHFLPSPKL